MDLLYLPPAFAVAVVALVAALCRKYPTFGLAIIVAIPYATRIIVGPTTLFHVTWACLALTTIYQVGTKQRSLTRLWKARSLLAPLLFLSLWTMVNIYLPVVPDLGLGWYRFNLFLLRALLPCGLLILFVSDRAGLRQFMLAVVLITLLTSALAVTQISTVASVLISEQDSRLGIYGVDALTLAAIGGVGLVFGLGLYARNRRRLIWLMLTLPPILIMLLMTKSRQAVVGMIAAVAVYVFLGRERRYWMFVLIVLLVLAGVAYNSMQGTAFFDRFAQTLDAPAALEWKRVEDYQEAFDNFISSPLSGIGTAQYGSCFSLIWTGSGALICDREHTHNLMLEILAEQGLMGFLPFLAFVVVGVRELLRARARGIDPQIADPLLAALAFSLVQTMFTGALFASHHVFWLLTLAYLTRDLMPEATLAGVKTVTSIRRPFARRFAL